MTCVRRQTVRNAARRQRGARGFTLIEVLMAAFVMAIGVLGLTALFAGAARQQQLSSQSTRSVAHARSAEAYISKRFGPIEAVVDNGKLVPPVRNNQDPVDEVRPDQWYAIPRTADGSISLNPDEAKDGWKNESLFTRSEPREVLPKLLFRTRFERREGEVVATGRPGGDKVAQSGFGTLDDTDNGAPALDAAMQQLRELRVLADSIKLRVVTRAFPCTGSSTNTDERSLSAPDDREIVLAWDGVNLPNGDIRLVGDDGKSEAIIRSERDAKDSELGSTKGQSRLTYIYIADVVDGINDPGCGGGGRYWVAFNESNPNPCEAGASPEYVWPVSSGGDVADGVGDAGTPGYSIEQGQVDGQRYLYAQLKREDVCSPSAQLYVQQAGGPYIVNSNGVNPPANAVTGTPLATVRTARFADRFIHEIWLEDYRYRAHTLVSMPESVTYAQSTEDQGLRVPQLGYSMLFRRTSDAAVQYALFSYAISPTYPPTADKADNTEDDYFPREDKQAIEENPPVSPIQLVQGLTLEFDKDLGLYFVKITTASKINSIGWVATPGQVLLFNGDASANPPIPGADAPVRVVNTRKLGANELRAYLDGPPRAGLRALPDFGSDKTFDAWVIAPKCEVTQRKPGKMIYYWGLKPVEARIFTVGQ